MTFGNSGIAKGTPGTQGTLDQANAENTAKQNEERLIDSIQETQLITKQPSTSDFIVIEEGQALHISLRKWLGVSKRNGLLRKTKNSLLRTAIDQLYRPKAIIGDGGTASVI